MKWLLWKTGPQEAALNMAFDETLLDFVEKLGAPILRLYRWQEPAATFGYFQKFSEIEAWTPLRPLIRRPTGGGLVPHDRDWTYTVVAPPGSDWYALRAEASYQRVHDWVRRAFVSLKQETTLSDCCVKEAPGRCFAGAEKFDLLWQGQKIAGAAQRRNKLGLLIQGSVQNQPPGARRTDWEAAMLHVASTTWSAEWSELNPSAEMLQHAERLRAEKYSRPEYNQRR